MFKKVQENGRAELGFVYTAQSPSQDDMREIERACARLFSTDDGCRVLGYLQGITFQRALGPTSPDEHLRFTEGQRALMATLLRLIDRGRGG